MKQLEAYQEKHPMPDGTNKEAYFKSLNEYVAKGTTTNETGKKRNDSITLNVRDVFVSKAKLLCEEQETFKARYQAQKLAAEQPVTETLKTPSNKGAASEPEEKPSPKLN